MTEYVTGPRQKIRWVSEAGTHGSLPSSGLIPLTNAKISAVQNQVFEPIYGAGTGSNTITYEPSIQDVTFDLTFNPKDWRLFVMAYGLSTNTVTGDNYTHTCSQRTQKDLESFSVQRISNLAADIVETYKGCKINAFQLNWNAAGSGTGKLVECVASCKAQLVNYTETEKTEEVSPTTRACFIANNIVVTLGGSAEKNCLSGNIRLESNTTDGFYSDASASLNRSEVEPQWIKGSVVLNLHYTASTYHAQWKAGTVFSGTNSIEIRRTASTDNMVFTFTNLRIESISAPTVIDGINVLTLNCLFDSVVPVAIDHRDDYSETDSS